MRLLGGDEENKAAFSLQEKRDSYVTVAETVVLNRDRNQASFHRFVI